MTVHDTVFQTGPLRLDFANRQAQVYNRTVDLTPNMWAMLRHLVDHDGTLRTFDELTVAVWGEPSLANGERRQTRTVDRLHRANWHRCRQLRSRLRAALGPAAFLIVSEVAASRLLILPPETEVPMSDLTYEYPASVVLQRARETRAMIEENERLTTLLAQIHAIARDGLEGADDYEAMRRIETLSSKEETRDREPGA